MNKAKAAQGPGELWAGSWSLSNFFAGPLQHLWRGGWSSPGPVGSLSLPHRKLSLKPWAKPSPALPREQGALSRERAARLPAHLLAALAAEQPGQPWQAGPRPGVAGVGGAEQGPWCLALCQSCSSCCHRCPVTAVPMSAPLLPPPLLPQQLCSGTDCWLLVLLCNHGALAPLAPL